MQTKYKKCPADKLGRREFVSNVIAAVSTVPLLMIPGAGTPEPSRNDLTVQQVIDLILKSIPGAPFKETVDTLKAGSPDQPVKGIVTTMFATNEVINKTIQGGANFIIAHEPTFYNHTDDTTWLGNSNVYQYKRELLKKHGIAVWRFHDYWHAYRPDGILMGVLTALGWEKYYDPQDPHFITLPATNSGQIIDLVKNKLGIMTVKVIGESSQVVSRVALLPGASGGRSQIETLQKGKPDLLICGELNEWETAEYIRDDRYMGSKTALIVLGHAVSEEPGMEWLVKWLQPQLLQVQIKHISSYDPFKYV